MFGVLEDYRGSLRIILSNFSLAGRIEYKERQGGSKMLGMHIVLATGLDSAIRRIST